MDATTEKMHKIIKTAQADPIFLLWKTVYEESREAFAAYANAQPEKIRNMLWSYAEAGRMMYQRLGNLACENMVFQKEE